MSYIAELINKECPECQGEKIAIILIRNGIVDSSIDYNYEIFKYYELRVVFHAQENFPIKHAIDDVKKKFRVNRFQLHRIRKRYSPEVKA